MYYVPAKARASMKVRSLTGTHFPNMAYIAGKVTPWLGEYAHNVQHTDIFHEKYNYLRIILFSMCGNTSEHLDDIVYCWPFWYNINIDLCIFVFKVSNRFVSLILFWVLGGKLWHNQLLYVLRFNHAQKIGYSRGTLLCQWWTLILLLRVLVRSKWLSLFKNLQRNSNEFYNVPLRRTY